jgi:hypothetical protein
VRRVYGKAIIEIVMFNSIFMVWDRCSNLSNEDSALDIITCKNFDIGVLLRPQQAKDEVL